MDLIITILPMVTKDLPISPRFTPYSFLSRCKFCTLTTRQPMVEFYLLAFPRFPLRKKEHESYFDENRTHDFRNSRCADYLLDHSGDELGCNGRDTLNDNGERLFFCQPRAYFSLSMEMSRLTRDGNAEPVSRDQILRYERGQWNIHFPCLAGHEQDWQPYPVDLYSCYI